MQGVLAVVGKQLSRSGSLRASRSLESLSVSRTGVEEPVRDSGEGEHASGAEGSPVNVGEDAEDKETDANSVSKDTCAGGVPWAVGDGVGDGMEAAVGPAAPQADAQGPVKRNSTSTQGV